MSSPAQALKRMLRSNPRQTIEDLLIDADYPEDFVDNVMGSLNSGASVPVHESSSTGMVLLEIRKKQIIRRSVLPPSGIGMNKSTRRKRGVKLQKLPIGVRFHTLVMKTSGNKERIVKFEGTYLLGDDVGQNRVKQAANNVAARKREPAMEKIRDQQRGINSRVPVPDDYALRRR